MLSSRRAPAVALLAFVFAQSLIAADRRITVALPPDGLSQKERAPFQQYLTEQFGTEVKLITPESFKATMDGLATGSIDFAYVGGLIYLKARAQAGVVPLVQRTSDLQFHSVFIAGSDKAIHSLRDLRGKKFAFGDVDSTSGHLIPYLEMKDAGLNPDRDMAVRFSGAHPLTVKLVEAGIVDAGAVDESIFKSLVSMGQIDPAKVHIFYTSKPFVDKVWVARQGIGQAERDKLAAALLRLKKGEDDEVLRILQADRFVRATDDEYEALRHVARELKMF